MTQVDSARFGGDAWGLAPGVGPNALVVATGQRAATEAHHRLLDQITAHRVPAAGSPAKGRGTHFSAEPAEEHDDTH